MIVIVKFIIIAGLIVWCVRRRRARKWARMDAEMEIRGVAPGRFGAVRNIGVVGGQRK